MTAISQYSRFQALVAALMWPEGDVDYEVVDQIPQLWPETFAEAERIVQGLGVRVKLEARVVPVLQRMYTVLDFLDPRLLPLTHKVTARFNKGELRTLCMDLGLDHESLADTDAGISKLAFAIVRYMDSNKRMNELIALLRKKRSNETWEAPPGREQVDED